MRRIVPKWDHKRERAKLQEWLSQAQSRIPLETCLSGIEADLQSDETPAQSLVLSLDILAASASASGAAAVLDGDPTGWKSIIKALRYITLYLKVFSDRLEEEIQAQRARHGEGRLRIGSLWWADLNDQLLWLATAMAMGEDKRATWCGNRIVQCLRTAGDRLFDGSAWSHTPFEPFMLRLFAIWQGDVPEFNATRGLNLGPYKGVLDSWTDPHGLADAIVQICDYHCRHCQSIDDPFQTVPFAPFPAEVLALQRVRKELGLATPEIKHPLLENNPMMNVPNPLPPVERDDLYDRVVARCRQLIRGFDLPWESSRN
jgi:hypothetical protein